MLTVRSLNNLANYAAVILCSLFLHSCQHKPLESSELISVQADKPTRTIRYLDNVYWPQAKACGRAYTMWPFLCRSNIQLAERPDLSKDGVYVFEVSKISMRLGLPLTMWFPYDLSSKLKAHEFGHCAMCEQIYQTAPDIARSCAQSELGKKFAERSPDVNSAQSTALRDARATLDADYRSHVLAKADGAGEIYDRITNHGMNDVPEDKAIPESFAEYAKNAAKPKQKPKSPSPVKLTNAKDKPSKPVSRQIFKPPNRNSKQRPQQVH